MPERTFYNGDFFIPHQNDVKQRDNVFKNIILKFAADNNIIVLSNDDKDWKHIERLYRLTNIKEGEEVTFQVGEQNPFNGQLILAIIRGINFYSIVNFDRRTKSLSYSMVDLVNNIEVVAFR